MERWSSALSANVLLSGLRFNELRTDDRPLVPGYGRNSPFCSSGEICPAASAGGNTALPECSPVTDVRCTTGQRGFFEVRYYFWTRTLIVRLNACPPAATGVASIFTKYTPLPLPAVFQTTLLSPAS